jgi:uncharacterized repeat protein (TIGR01451 family)
LYAPNTWSSGSSIYHVAESYNGTPHALMTWSLSSGESIHDPGSVVRGILVDVGWQVNEPTAVVDLSISKVVAGNGAPSPGETAIFRITVRNEGTIAATGVVVTDALPAYLASPSWSHSSSLAGISVRSGTYVWSLPDLDPGASGVITVSGTIAASLPDDYVLWNRTTIAAGEAESKLGNNESAALVGGHRVYLPVALKGG